jgi:hypothetical protein
MPYFSTAAEVDCYVGGILRLACGDIDVRSRLAAAHVTLRLVSEEPHAELTFSMLEPVTVVCGPTDLVPDVTFTCPGDVLDSYWRGEYSLLQGLARGEVRARGPVSRVLKVLPALEPMFPAYLRLVAGKDAAAARCVGV